ncbi:hypothetical protein E6A49_11435 [Brachyspira pilosicoli]|nr:hypothetical protein [Brachyspira pilosicoli]
MQVVNLALFIFYIPRFCRFVIFLCFYYLQGFAPHPTSFATEGSALAACHKEAKRLHFLA